MSRTIVGGMLVAFFAFPVSAATVRVGDHDLGTGRGPGNEVYIEVIGDDLEVGTGGAFDLALVDVPPPDVTPAPVFTAITTDFAGAFFENPTVMTLEYLTSDTANVETLINGVFDISNPPNKTVTSTPTALVRLTVDTTSVPAGGGTWQLGLGITAFWGFVEPWTGDPAPQPDDSVTVLESGTITVGAVPEPGTMTLLLSALASVFFFWWRRK